MGAQLLGVTGLKDEFLQENIFVPLVGAQCVFFFQEGKISGKCLIDVVICKFMNALAALAEAFRGVRPVDSSESRSSPEHHGSMIPVSSKGTPI